LKAYEFSARRNSVSFAVNLRMMLSTCAGVSVSAPLMSFSLVFMAGGVFCAKPAALALNRSNVTNANDLSRAIDNLIINPLVFLMLSDWQPLVTALTVNYTNVRLFVCNPLR
jgi:hypothetical protein